jgi:hypothetical protein
LELVPSQEFVDVDKGCGVIATFLPLEFERVINVLDQLSKDGSAVEGVKLVFGVGLPGRESLPVRVIGPKIVE